MYLFPYLLIYLFSMRLYYFKGHLEKDKWRMWIGFRIERCLIGINCMLTLHCINTLLLTLKLMWLMLTCYNHIGRVPHVFLYRFISYTNDFYELISMQNYSGQRKFGYMASYWVWLHGTFFSTRGHAKEAPKIIPYLLKRIKQIPLTHNLWLS